MQTLVFFKALLSQNTSLFLEGDTCVTQRMSPEPARCVENTFPWWFLKTPRRDSTVTHMAAPTYRMTYGLGRPKFIFIFILFSSSTINIDLSLLKPWHSWDLTPENTLDSAVASCIMVLRKAEVPFYKSLWTFRWINAIFMAFPESQVLLLKRC